MTTRVDLTASHHDQLVRLLYEDFKAQGYTELRADGLEGIAMPDTIPGNGQDFRPDVTGVDPRRNVFVIAEVEMPDDFGSDHTAGQLTTFNAAAESSPNTEFLLVVPTGASDRARRLQLTLGLTVAQVREMAA